MERRSSLCIPTHNNASVISDALSSALRQTCSPFEILVLDNCSTDDTEGVIRKLASGHPHVRYVRHPENIGMAGNFSACVALARGEYVQILCADDALEPTCVEVLQTALHNEPASVLAACGRTLVDEALRPLRVVRARARREVVPGSRLARECFVEGNVIGEPSAVMFRREAALRGFNADYSQLLDLDMWFHLLSQGAGVLLPEALCLVRQHDKQVTERNIHSGRVIQDKQRLFQQVAASLTADLTMRDKILWDARMASSVARVRLSGGVTDVSAISEIFFKRLFMHVLVPTLSLAVTRIGFGRRT